jgi:phosphoribosylglycinamide formyltransferase 1
VSSPRTRAVDRRGESRTPGASTLGRARTVVDERLQVHSDRSTEAPAPDVDPPHLDRFGPNPDGLRVVVLISGGGSNLAALLASSAVIEHRIEIVAVGADRHSAGGLQHAAAADVPWFVERISDHPDRDSWDRSLTERTAGYRPDLVISAGFLKLVGPRFLERFRGRYINTHNALLPAFPGMHGPRDALRYGVKIAGATLFVVDAGVDSGPILAQVSVPVLDDDSEDTLTERIKAAERAQLVEQVSLMATHGWTIQGRRVSTP